MNIGPKRELAQCIGRDKCFRVHLQLLPLGFITCEQASNKKNPFDCLFSVVGISRKGKCARQEGRCDAELGCGGRFLEIALSCLLAFFRASSEGGVLLQ